MEKGKPSYVFPPTQLFFVLFFVRIPLVLIIQENYYLYTSAYFHDVRTLAPPTVNNFRRLMKKVG